MRTNCTCFWLAVVASLMPSGARCEEASVTQLKGNRLEHVVFVPHRDLVVGVCQSEPQGSIRFWSTGDGALRSVLELGDHVWAPALTVSDNGDLLAVSMLPSTVGCYSLAENRWLWKVAALDNGIVGDSMVFTADSKRLIVVTVRDIQTYDAMTGAVLKRQHDAQAFSAGFPDYQTRSNHVSPSGRLAAFWQGNLEHDEGQAWHSRNVWVAVWDIERGTPILRKAKLQEKYKNSSAAFTQDERSLLLGSMDGQIRVLSLANQKVADQWRVSGSFDIGTFADDPSPYPVEAMEFSPDSQLLAVMARAGISVWTWPDHRLVKELPGVCAAAAGGIGQGYPLAFSEDGRFLAFEDHGRLCLYETKTWTRRWSVPSWK